MPPRPRAMQAGNVHAGRANSTARCHAGSRAPPPWPCPPAPRPSAPSPCPPRLRGRLAGQGRDSVDASRAGRGQCRSTVNGGGDSARAGTRPATAPGRGGSSSKGAARARARTLGGEGLGADGFEHRHQRVLERARLVLSLHLLRGGTAGEARWCVVGRAREGGTAERARGRQRRRRALPARAAPHARHAAPVAGGSTGGSARERHWDSPPGSWPAPPPWARPAWLAS